MDTICRDCVFAQKEDDIQYGCDFGRIEAFRLAGAEVIEEKDPENENCTYFRIKDRVCNACRNEGAVSKIPVRLRHTRILEEIKIRVAMIVYMNGQTQEEDVYRTLESIYRQTLAPYEIVLVYSNNGEVAPYRYSNWILEQTETHPIRWSVESIKFADVDYYSAIDIVVKSKNMKSTFYSACQAGHEYDLDYLEIINKAINTNMQQLVALLPDSKGNEIFVQRGLHNFLQGNKPVETYLNIIDKIRFIAEEENNPNIVKTMNEIRYG